MNALDGRSWVSDLTDWDPDTQPMRPDRSLGELISELSSEMGTLLRKEVELAKLEAKEEGSRLARSVGMFGGAGLAGWLALLFVSFALAWLLDQALNTALSFAIIGVAWGIAALVMVSMAKKQLQQTKALPTTTETIKEDVEWARALKS